MTIVIVDTGVANRHSIRNALEHIGCDVTLSADAAAIRDADKLVFPGVGAFEAGMRSLACARTCRGVAQGGHGAAASRSSASVSACR